MSIAHEDDFDPDQPRDETGKWATGSGGGAAGKVNLAHVAQPGFAKEGNYKSVPSSTEGKVSFGQSQAAHVVETKPSHAHAVETKANPGHLSPGDGPGRVSAYGGDPEVANSLVSGFVSNVFHPKAIELKGAVAQVFGVPVKQDVDRIAKAAQANEKKKAPAFQNKSIASIEGARRATERRLEVGAKHSDTVRAMAKASQDHYPADHVVLYRGVTGKQAEAIIAARKSGKPVNLKVDTASSFTDSHAVAKSFAKYGPNRTNASQHAVVLKVTVPRSSIVASHLAFKKLSKEREVIVASHGGFDVSPENITVL